MGGPMMGAGGKGGSSGGGGGMSGIDIQAIMQALGMGTTELHNRYKQLGLGTPDPNVFGGDPATAAAAGGSLEYGGAGTAETTDINQLGSLASAALGTLQNQNTNNPAVPGSSANQLFNIQQAGQTQTALGQLAQTQQQSSASGAGGGVDLNTPTPTG